MSTVRANNYKLFKPLNEKGYSAKHSVRATPGDLYYRHSPGKIIDRRPVKTSFSLI
jgi:hypothetical protein